MATWLILVALIGAGGEPPKPDPRLLAQQIDERIDASLEAARAVASDAADDAELLRRLNLDLIGRIPTAAEVRAFLADSDPDKRNRLIDRLSESPEHARHFARVWRALLLPEAESEPQVRYFVPGFEAWIDRRRRERAGFDAIVRELLSVPIARPGELPQFVLRDMRRPNPLAFMAAKEAQPAKIASSAVRLFLGLRLECAQCHDHPFDHWTREQFWNQAAFFAGIERRGKGTFAPLTEDPRRRSVAMEETETMVPVLFLDHSAPRDDDQPARVQWSQWMTAAENPYFACSIANRIWSQFMGRGLVEPVDDFRASNAPSHPELLDELADAFRASGFDVDYLQRAICLSRTYQRTSRQTDLAQAQPELFARAAIKRLSGEQFFDSFAQATGYVAPDERGGDDEDPLQRRLVGLFEAGESTGDPETSVTQALALMNGPDVHGAVTSTGKRLKQVLADFPGSPKRQIDELYLSALGRFPWVAEREAIDAFLDKAGEDERARRVGDVFWVLLNSAEFRWNH